MRKPILLVAALMCCTVSVTAGPLPDTEEQIMHGDDTSGTPIVSADGRWVAFQSLATNLVPGDTHGHTNVYLYDRKIGELRLISSVNGLPAPGHSFLLAMSADGSVISLVSGGNLTPDAPTGPGLYPYVYRANTDQLQAVPAFTPLLLALSTNGKTAAGWDGSLWAFVDTETFSAESLPYLRYPTRYPSVDVSGDGRFLVTTSGDRGTPEGDDNGFDDVYLYDRETGEFTLVTRGLLGDGTNGHSSDVSISADGTTVTFASEATNLPDGVCVPVALPGDPTCPIQIYSWDRMTEQITLVSSNSARIPGDNHSYFADIGGDGRFVTFISASRNFNPLRQNALSLSPHLYVKDTLSGILIRMSPLIQALDPLSSAWPYPTISSDGRWIAAGQIGVVGYLNGSQAALDIFVLRNPLQPG